MSCCHHHTPQDRSNTYPIAKSENDRFTLTPSLSSSHLANLRLQAPQTTLRTRWSWVWSICLGARSKSRFVCRHLKLPLKYSQTIPHQISRFYLSSCHFSFKLQIISERANWITGIFLIIQVLPWLSCANPLDSLALLCIFFLIAKISPSVFCITDVFLMTFQPFKLRPNSLILTWIWKPGTRTVQRRTDPRFPWIHFSHTIYYLKRQRVILSKYWSHPTAFIHTIRNLECYCLKCLLVSFLLF